MSEAENHGAGGGAERSANETKGRTKTDARRTQLLMKWLRDRLSTSDSAPASKSNEGKPVSWYDELLVSAAFDGENPMPASGAIVRDPRD